MTPEVLVPASSTAQALAFGIAIGAVLAGGLAWAWGWSRGHDAGWQGGAAEGWVKGVNDAGVLDRLLRIEGASDVESVLKRHELAVEKWRAEQEPQG